MAGRADRSVAGAAALAEEGKLEQAVALLRRAAAGRDRPLAPHLLLAEYLTRMGRHDAALFHARQAQTLAPARWEGPAAVGLALQGAGQWPEAEAAFREASRLDDGAAMARSNLGLLLQQRGAYEEAEREFRAAIAADPATPLYVGNLALLRVETARVEEAAALLREALERFPGAAPLLSNLSFALNYLQDRVTPEDVLQAHRAFGAALSGGAPIGRGIDASPDRPLRVGYISPDFRAHSVARFIGPALEHHDREQFNVTCYHVSPRADEVTARLRRLGHRWRDAGAMTDADFAALVRADRIDILVDLAGLTAGTRITAMAMRTAPVQVTYIGYPNTTGVPAIDARLVDEITDPPGSDSLACERLVRLPGCFLAYRPDSDMPEPGVDLSGPVMFGSFNALAKVSPTTVGLWSRVLRAVPESRLLLKAKALGDTATQARVRGWFERAGIDPTRLELTAQTRDVSDHLSMYRRVHVALDTTPYNGTTTTCEALWMGVPVVTILGRTHAGRVSASLLRAAGLAEWVASDPEAFVSIAARLASDRGLLAELRRGLRARLAGSTLLDGAGLTRRVERAYRDLWEHWCAARGAPTL